MNRRCVIGGAAGLIGQSVAQTFKSNDYQVFSLDKEELQGVISIDLTREEEVSSFYQENFSGKAHSVLVNCQAIAEPYVAPLWELESSVWSKYLETNLNSYFYMCKHFIKRHLADQGESASIINISSTRHLMAEKHTEPYCATKGAIDSFSKALAISAGDKNVRVNTISPGWIASEVAQLRPIDHSQHPAGRVGRPQDIAEACLFLADPKNSFITGEDLIIDGGMAAKMIYED